MIHLWMDFCGKILQLLICQFFMRVKNHMNWSKAQFLDFWKNHSHNFIFSFNISNMHGSILSPWTCRISMHALLFFVHSTHARDKTSDSRSESGNRVKPMFWIFLKTLEKEEKLAKANYMQYRLGYCSHPQRKKWRDLNDRIFNWIKSIRTKKYENRRVLDK